MKALFKMFLEGSVCLTVSLGTLYVLATNPTVLAVVAFIGGSLFVGAGVQEIRDVTKRERQRQERGQ